MRRAAPDLAIAFRLRWLLFNGSCFSSVANVMKQRTLKWLLLAFVVFSVAYVSAFFASVGQVHVGRLDAPGEPRRPQFALYASRRSKFANCAAHLAFLPLVRLCEATGEFEYADETTGIDLEPAPLAGRLWGVLTEK